MNMKKFNKALNADITELKTLHMKKDKSDFNKRKAEIMAKHKISKATVYREMKKDNPGYYRRPQYNPPVREITEKEKELLGGMLYRQMDIERIRHEMESRFGMSYSWDRIDMIRSEIEKETEAHQKNKKKLSQEKNGTGLKSGLGIETRLCIETGHKAKQERKYDYEIPGGEDVGVFIEKIFSIKDMVPGTFIRIKIKGHELKIGYDAVKDIQRITTNSAAAGGMNILETAKINNKHLCAEQIRHFSQGKVHGIKDLVMIDKILKDYESEGPKCGSDFDYFLKVVQHFAPKVTREDLVVFLSFNPPPEGSVSESFLPDLPEIETTVSAWCKKNI